VTWEEKDAQTAMNTRPIAEKPATEHEFLGLAKLEQAEELARRTHAVGGDDTLVRLLPREELVERAFSPSPSGRGAG
jgi:hypothetical protein